MNTFFKRLWIVLGVVIVTAVIIGVSGWLYFKSNLVSFESAYEEKTNFSELTIAGYTFLDRNENGVLDPYEDARLKTSDRVNNIIAQMTMDEKIHLLKGSGLASAMGNVEDGKGIPGAVGTIVPTPRLGLPTLYLSDGPAGLRIEPKRDKEERTYYCTAFPIGTLVASTWNMPLAQEIGDAMGKEAAAYGIDVILGPAANIHRHPLCGRNFEYFSEDPVLSGNIGAGIVNGIEANGVGTSVKHFVANNQETDRTFNDVIVSDRALRELYLKSFEIIVREAQPWTLMSSYNKINGTYTSQDKELLTGILRDEWGFEGVVMSDWFGGRDAPAQIRAGNDLLEPGTKWQWEELIEAQEKGSLSEQQINTSVARILTLVVESKKMKNLMYDNNPDLKKHATITRRSASEGMVLLKNEQTLPVPPSNTVALFGVTSFEFIAGGTGSGDVNEAYTISLEQGLTNAGFVIEPASKQAFAKHKAANEKAFVKPEGFNAMFEPYNPPQLLITDEQLEESAQNANLAIITIGRNSGEGGDRVEKNDFLLTAVEQEMIERVCNRFHESGKKVIVVLNVGGVIETATWKSKPDAILLAWQGGQEGGNSVADLISGKVNPSGKLPMTFPIHLDDHASNANFPLEGKPMDPMEMIFPSDEKAEDEKIVNSDYTVYEEDIYVGYRHFDTKDIAVSYPFGYGLSYSQFTIGQPSVTRLEDTIEVTLAVTNTGFVSGKEVVQLYIEKPESTIKRASQELKAFLKTKNLQPEEATEVTLSFPISDLSYWDEATSQWQLEPGDYLLKVGTSSRDIKGSTTIKL